MVAGTAIAGAIWWLSHSATPGDGHPAPKLHELATVAAEQPSITVAGLTILATRPHSRPGCSPADQARALRDWTRLPVAVCGDVSPADHVILRSRH